MEIDFNLPPNQDGFIQTSFTLIDEIRPSQFERLVVTVWTEDSDSNTAISEAARAAGIELLKRALTFLRA